MYLRHLLFVSIGMLCLSPGIMATLVQKSADGTIYKTDQNSCDSLETLWKSIEDGDIETIKTHISAENVNTYEPESGCLQQNASIKILCPC